MASRRAPRGESRRATPVSAEELERALSGLRERLAAEGAVKVASIVPKGARSELSARLAAEGHELAGTWLRRPIRQQIREALGHGAALTKKALASLVRGASGTELTRVANELASDGEIYRVLRGKSETLTGSGSEVLTPQALAGLKPLIAQLYQALAAASRKKGMTLLASDVEELLAGARSVLDRNACHDQRDAAPGKARERDAAPGKARERDATPSEPPDSGVRSLLEALDATRDTRTGLSFVPRVVERLLPSVSLAVAHQMLLQAARDERIELRPEGGLARLTSDELGLCPAGPGGMRLSWARRLGGAA